MDCHQVTFLVNGRATFHLGWENSYWMVADMVSRMCFIFCIIEYGHSGRMEDCALIQVKIFFLFFFHITWSWILDQHAGTIITPSQKLNLDKTLSILDLETGRIFSMVC